MYIVIYQRPKQPSKMKISRTTTVDQKPVTFITEGTRFTGKIESTGTIRVDGDLIGDIEVKGKLITGPNSLIDGTIRAGEAVIGGKVKGDLYGADCVVLQSTGRIKGTINTDEIIIEKGGLFEGECNMRQQEVEMVEMEVKLLERQA